VGFATAYFLWSGLSIPIPFFRDISIIDGWSDDLVRQERAICDAAKAKSLRDAAEADSMRHLEAAKDHARQVGEANERALTAQQTARSYVEEVAVLDEELQDCRKSTPADDARVQP
jgi:hypothetical protein